MRLIGGAVTVLLAVLWTANANAHQDYDEPSPSSSLLRGTETVQAQASDGGRALQEDDHTIADHGGHSEHDYVESECNANLDIADCYDWSEYWSSASEAEPSDTDTITNSYFESEVKIPCGVCVTLDASPGDALYGAAIEFGEGLNIVGKLVIPNDAKVHLQTKYIYVQGVLSMPEPPSGSSNGLPSDEDGDRVEITLYGLDDLVFKADEETDNYHHGEKGVHNKAIVVAGGKSRRFFSEPQHMNIVSNHQSPSLYPFSPHTITITLHIGRLDIHAMDPTCPSWVKLQSIEYGTPLPNIALHKPAVESSTFAYWQGNPTGHSASQAVDDNDQSYTHTNCWTGINQWWQVDLEDMYSIQNIEVVNRQDCCSHRLHDYDIFFMDSNMTVVDSIYVAGQNGNRKTISTGKLLWQVATGRTLGSNSIICSLSATCSFYQNHYPTL